MCEVVSGGGENREIIYLNWKSRWKLLLGNGVVDFLIELGILG